MARWILPRFSEAERTPLAAIEAEIYYNETDDTVYYTDGDGDAVPLGLGEGIQLSQLPSADSANQILVTNSELVLSHVRT
jgi:hypothetical protein